MLNDRSVMVIVGCIMRCWMIGFMVLSFLGTTIMYLWTSHNNTLSKFWERGGGQEDCFCDM